MIAALILAAALVLLAVAAAFSALTGWGLASLTPRQIAARVVVCLLALAGAAVLLHRAGVL